MRARFYFLVAMSLAATACSPGQATVPHAGRARASVSPEPATVAARSRRPPIRPPVLAPVPRRGFAVQGRDGVVLVVVTGTVFERIPGFSISGNTGNTGVWLEQGRAFFRLDQRRDRLRPVARRAARERVYDEGAEPDLRTPSGTRYRGDIVGHWRYAYRGAGGALLAQWSGECESPTAYWVDSTGARIVTGENDLSKSPESKALGWSPDGLAFVYLGEGLCGGRGDPPGIYAFTSPGDGRLIYRTPPEATVDMWGVTAP